MKIRCAWCQSILGEKEPLSDDSVADGICDNCLMKYFPNVYEKCRGLEVSEEDRYEKLHVRRG